MAEILDDEGTRLPGDGRKAKRQVIMAKGEFSIPEALYEKIQDNIEHFKVDKLHNIHL